MISMLLAHGLGDAGDLPVELPVVLFFAAGLVLLAAWRADRRVVAGTAAPVMTGATARPGSTATTPSPPLATADQPTGRPLPRLTAFADAPATRVVLRTATVVFLLLVVVTAALGAPTASQNPAPRMVFVLFWGTLIPASLLFGSLWRVVNPFRTLASGLARLSGDAQWRTAAPLPEHIGVWPAVVQLAVFVWGVHGASERAGGVLVLVLAITAVQLLAVNRYGPAWFRHGDPFEVVAELVASVSPLGRGSQGLLELRAPSVSARALQLPAGTAALMALLMGSYLADFVMDTPPWHTWRAPLSRGGQLALDSVTLLIVVALVAVAVALVTRRSRFLLGALVPVVIGIAVGHDFGVLLIEGQFAFIQLSDPFAAGWDLLGLSGRYVPAEPIPAMAVALTVIAVMIAGHIAAASLGRSLTIPRFRGRAATAAQLPLRTFLVLSVVVTIFLRLSVE